MLVVLVVSMYKLLFSQTIRYAPRVISWALTVGGGVWFGSRNPEIYTWVKEQVSTLAPAKEVRQRTFSQREVNAAQLRALLDLYHGDTYQIKQSNQGNK